MSGSPDVEIIKKGYEKVAPQIGITTRLMAKRLENMNSAGGNSVSSMSQSKFLTGTQVPNSIRRASLSTQKASTMSVSQSSRRATLDTLSNLSKRSRSSQEEQIPMMISSGSSNKTLRRIRRSVVQESEAELRKVSSTRMKLSKPSSMMLSQVSLHERELERSRKLSSVKSQMSQVTVARRKSTLEDIREAIASSQEMLKLINADAIEKEKNQSQAAIKETDSFAGLLNTLKDKDSKTRRLRMDSATQTSTEFEEVKKLLAEKAKLQNKSPNQLNNKTSVNR